MGKITDMKECRNKARVNIYIDGEFCVAVDKFVAYKSFLKIGKEISEEKLKEIAFEEARESALKKGIAYVSKYRVTEKKARDYLKGKDYPAEIVEETMAKLQKYSFISDQQYAVDFMASKQNRKGGKMIKMQLREKGVSSEIIESLEVDSEKEKETAKKLGLKYMKNKENTRENFGKLFGNLASKGFDFDVVKAVCEEIKGEWSDDEDWM